MTCYTLLLNIYVAVLIVLQHDVHPSAQAALEDDMRTISTVHLYSYLIKRQHRAVSSYISDGGDGWASDDEMLIKDLRMEIQQRLDRLHQTLHI